MGKLIGIAIGTDGHIHNGQVVMGPAGIAPCVGCAFLRDGHVLFSSFKIIVIYRRTTAPTSLFLKGSETRPASTSLTVERMKGIEPSYEAWEATALPLSYIRILKAILKLADFPPAFKIGSQQPIQSTPSKSKG